MACDATRKIEAGQLAKTGKVGTGLSRRALSLGGLWRVIPDVSLRTRAGLAALAVAALIGVTAALGAILMAAVPQRAQLVTAHIVAVCRSALGAPSGEEAAFLAENRAAMATMMAGMDIKPSGDVDRDFVDMMVPHHQGAIDVAQGVLRYGHNEKIRRLAQEIIITQQQEIAVMRLAVGEPLSLLPTVHAAANGN
jgi:hypothetical protein